MNNADRAKLLSDAKGFSKNRLLHAMLKIPESTSIKSILK